MPIIRDILDSNNWADEVKAQVKTLGALTADELPDEIVARINFEDFPKDIFDLAAKKIGTVYMTEGFETFEARLRQRQQELKGTTPTISPKRG